MSNNPFESPQSSGGGANVSGFRREDLRSIAKYQKGILVCIGLYLFAIAAQSWIPPEHRVFIGLSMVAVGIAATLFVFRLASMLFYTRLAVMLAILTIVPGLGLIFLLVINAKASRALHDNGIPAGLFGAEVYKI